MKIYVRWVSLRPPPLPDVRLARFRRVLLAALQVRRYRHRLRAEGLGTPEAVSSVHSVESTLPLLPVTDFEEFQGSPEDFENDGARSSGPQRLRYPLGQAPRTAVLIHGFEERDLVKQLPPEWYRIAAFHPEVLAAPVGMLRTLAEAVARGRIRLPPLKYAAIAFTGVREGLLREQDRDLLWNVFQVPVFEQHLGPDGRLVAWECEAHNGLHLVPANAVVEQAADSRLLLTSLTGFRRPALRLRTTFRGSVVQETCPCGETTPKLLELHEVVDPERAPLAVAASG